MAGIVIGLTRLEIRSHSSHAVVFAVPPMMAALIDVATAGTLAGATFGLIAAKRGGAVLVGFLCNAFWMLVELVPPKIQGVPIPSTPFSSGGWPFYGLLSGPFAGQARPGQERFGSRFPNAQPRRSMNSSVRYFFAFAIPSAILAQPRR